MRRSHLGEDDSLILHSFGGIGKTLGGKAQGESTYFLPFRGHEASPFSRRRNHEITLEKNATTKDLVKGQN